MSKLIPAKDMLEQLLDAKYHYEKDCFILPNGLEVTVEYIQDQVLAEHAKDKLADQLAEHGKENLVEQLKTTKFFSMQQDNLYAKGTLLAGDPPKPVIPISTQEALEQYEKLIDEVEAVKKAKEKIAKHALNYGSSVQKSIKIPSWFTGSPTHWEMLENKVGIPNLSLMTTVYLSKSHKDFINKEVYMSPGTFADLIGPGLKKLLIQEYEKQAAWQQQAQELMYPGKIAPLEESEKNKDNLHEQVQVLTAVLISIMLNRGSVEISDNEEIVLERDTMDKILKQFRLTFDFSVEKHSYIVSLK